MQYKMTVQVRTPIIVLVKFHFRVSTELCKAGNFMQYVQKNQSSDQNCIRHNNFVILRSKSHTFVYTVFDSGFINCTGSKSLESIPEAIKYVKETIFKGKVEIYAFKIDTITGCSHYGRSIRLSSIKCVPKLSADGADDDLVYRISFNPESFAGLTIRFPGQKGTLNVFSTGQIVIIGAQNSQDMLKVYRMGCTIISRCISLTEK